MAKTLITLDFDGVVSPIDKERDFEADSEFAIYRLGGFNCALRKPVISFIQELAAVAEASPERLLLVWASSWNDLTTYFPEQSKGALPELPYLDTSRGKGEAIVAGAHEASAQNIISFDDDRRVISKLRRVFNADVLSSQGSLLAFTPRLKVGITDQQMSRVRNLLRESHE